VVYRLTGCFPESERYGLTSQMRRAVVSVTSNIAEAFGRQTSKDKVRFYMNARGSCYEVQSQTYVACDVGHVAPEDSACLDHSLNDSIHELNKVIKALSTRSQP